VECCIKDFIQCNKSKQKTKVSNLRHVTFELDANYTAT